MNVENNKDPSINSVVFFRSYYNSILLMSEENQLEIYNAIFNYAFNGIIPSDLSNEVKSVFLLMKPNIDSSINRYKASVENGKKGGRPKKENLEKPKRNLTQTQYKPTTNLNYNKEYNLNVDKEKLDTLYDN